MNASEKYKETVEKILLSFERDGLKFIKPWSNPDKFNPINFMTNQPYRNFNHMFLAMDNHDDHRFMTFNQAKQSGFKIKKHSTGIPVFYYQPANTINYKHEIGEDGKPILDKNNDPIILESKSSGMPIFSMSYVFNCEDIEGCPQLPAYEPVAPQPKLPEVLTKRLDALVDIYGVPIKHGGTNACYIPSIDTICMPKPELFHEQSGYYATLIHELMHSTGHETRLARTYGKQFGDRDYALEELTAELGSAYVCCKLGINQESRQDLDQHAAYLKSWVGAIRENPRILFTIAKESEKASDLFLGVEQVKQVEPKQSIELELA